MFPHCASPIVFVPLDHIGTSFFGFSEFLTALALMVLVWTVAGSRYEFRIRIAPLPLHELTFIIVVLIGVLTLLTDIWRAEQRLVPQGSLLTPAIWQALLAACILSIFFMWAWFAFIRPPKFGKSNAERFVKTLYKIIIKGSPEELAVIADELASSAKSLVYFSSQKTEEGSLSSSNVVTCADDVLWLIADKRFCRQVVASSPLILLKIFQEMRESGKYDIPIQVFSKNIINEALCNKNAFPFHETEGYHSGLLGYEKPISQIIFGNYRMVEAINTLLDVDWKAREKWDSDQWEAYCRLVLIAFQDYFQNHLHRHSFVLRRALDYIQSSISDLYKINNIPNVEFDTHELNKLRVVIDFYTEAVELLNSIEIPKNLILRIKNHAKEDFYDYLAELGFKIIYTASAIRSSDLCWVVQHNTVYSALFNRLHGKSADIIKFKIRRLLYNEVCEMNKLPSYKSASILGFLLNVMGLEIHNTAYERDTRALHKVILAWTKKNYSMLHFRYPKVSEKCLMEGITYDKENNRLVKTYPEFSFTTEPKHTYFYLDPIEPE